MIRLIRNIVIGVLISSAIVHIFDLGPKKIFSLPIRHKYGEMPSPQNIQYAGIVRLQLSAGSCSGWVIDIHYAITAAHCISTGGYMDNSPIKLFSSSGIDTAVIANAVAYDTDLDLGLISGNFSMFQPIPTDFYNDGFSIETEEMYVTMGYPLGQKRLSSAKFFPVGSEYFFIKGVGRLAQGMSGGPALNSKGIAVGINSAVSQEHSLVSPIRGFLGRFGLE